MVCEKKEVLIRIFIILIISNVSELNSRSFFFVYKIFHKVSNTPMYFQDQFYIPDRVRLTRKEE